MIISASALAMVLGPVADHGSIVTVADTPNRGFDARFGKALGVFDRQILAAPFAVIDQPHALPGAAIMHRLFQGVKDETRMRRGADAPTSDPAGIGVDDRAMGTPLVRVTMARGDIDEPLPGNDIGKIADPKHVRRRHPELAVCFVQRTKRLLVRDRRLVRLAPDNVWNPHVLHQPRQRASRDIEALVAKLPPDLPDAIDLPVPFEDSKDLGAQRLVAARPIRQSGRISARFSRSSAFLRSAISVGMPARLPLSTSAFLTESFSVWAEQPIFAAIDTIACQRKPC